MDPPPVGMEADTQDGLLADEQARRSGKHTSRLGDVEEIPSAISKPNLVHEFSHASNPYTNSNAEETEADSNAEADFGTSGGEEGLSFDGAAHLFAQGQSVPSTNFASAALSSPPHSRGSAFGVASASSQLLFGQHHVSSHENLAQSPPAHHRPSGSAASGFYTSLAGATPRSTTAGAVLPPATVASPGTAHTPVAAPGGSTAFNREGMGPVRVFRLQEMAGGGAGSLGGSAPSSAFAARSSGAGNQPQHQQQPLSPPSPGVTVASSLVSTLGLAALAAVAQSDGPGLSVPPSPLMSAAFGSSAATGAGGGQQHHLQPVSPPQQQQQAQHQMYQRRGSNATATPPAAASSSSSSSAAGASGAAGAGAGGRRASGQSSRSSPYPWFSAQKQHHGGNSGTGAATNATTSNASAFSSSFSSSAAAIAVATASPPSGNTPAPASSSSSSFASPPSSAAKARSNAIAAAGVVINQRTPQQHQQQQPSHGNSLNSNISQHNSQSSPLSPHSPSTGTATATATAPSGNPPGFGTSQGRQIMMMMLQAPGRSGSVTSLGSARVSFSEPADFYSASTQGSTAAPLLLPAGQGTAASLNSPSSASGQHAAPTRISKNGGRGEQLQPLQAYDHDFLGQSAGDHASGGAGLALVSSPSTAASPSSPKPGRRSALSTGSRPQQQALTQPLRVVGGGMSVSTNSSQSQSQGQGLPQGTAFSTSASGTAVGSPSSPSSSAVSPRLLSNVSGGHGNNGNNDGSSSGSGPQALAMLHYQQQQQQNYQRPGYSQGMAAPPSASPGSSPINQHPSPAPLTAPVQAGGNLSLPQQPLMPAPSNSFSSLLASVAGAPGPSTQPMPVAPVVVVGGSHNHPQHHPTSFSQAWQAQLAKQQQFLQQREQQKLQQQQQPIRTVGAPSGSSIFSAGAIRPTAGAVSGPFPAPVLAFNLSNAPPAAGASSTAGDASSRQQSTASALSSSRQQAQAAQPQQQVLSAALPLTNRSRRPSSTSSTPSLNGSFALTGPAIAPGPSGSSTGASVSVSSRPAMVPPSQQSATSGGSLGNRAQLLGPSSVPAAGASNASGTSPSAGAASVGSSLRVHASTIRQITAFGAGTPHGRGAATPTLLPQPPPSPRLGVMLLVGSQQPGRQPGAGGTAGNGGATFLSSLAGGGLSGGIPPPNFGLAGLRLALPPSPAGSVASVSLLAADVNVGNTSTHHGHGGHSHHHRRNSQPGAAQHHGAPHPSSQSLSQHTDSLSFQQGGGDVQPSLSLSGLGMPLGKDSEREREFLSAGSAGFGLDGHVNRQRLESGGSWMTSTANEPAAALSASSASAGEPAAAFGAPSGTASSSTRATSAASTTASGFVMGLSSEVATPASSSHPSSVAPGTRSRRTVVAAAAATGNAKMASAGLASSPPVLAPRVTGGSSSAVASAAALLLPDGSSGASGGMQLLAMMRDGSRSRSRASAGSARRRKHRSGSQPQNQPQAPSLSSLGQVSSSNTRGGYASPAFGPGSAPASALASSPPSRLVFSRSSTAQQRCTSEGTAAGASSAGGGAYSSRGFLTYGDIGEHDDDAAADDDFDRNRATFDDDEDDDDDDDADDEHEDRPSPDDSDDSSDHRRRREGEAEGEGERSRFSSAGPISSAAARASSTFTAGSNGGRTTNLSRHSGRNSRQQPHSRPHSSLRRGHTPHQLQNNADGATGTSSVLAGEGLAGRRSSTTRPRSRGSVPRASSSAGPALMTAASSTGASPAHLVPSSQDDLSTLALAQGQGYEAAIAMLNAATASGAGLQQGDQPVFIDGLIMMDGAEGMLYEGEPMLVPVQYVEGADGSEYAVIGADAQQAFDAQRALAASGSELEEEDSLEGSAAAALLQAFELGSPSSSPALSEQDKAEGAAGERKEEEDNAEGKEHDEGDYGSHSSLTALEAAASAAGAAMAAAGAGRQTSGKSESKEGDEAQEADDASPRAAQLSVTIASKAPVRAKRLSGSMQSGASTFNVRWISRPPAPSDLGRVGSRKATSTLLGAGGAFGVASLKKGPASSRRKKQAKPIRSKVTEQGRAGTASASSDGGDLTAAVTTDNAAADVTFTATSASNNIGFDTEERAAEAATGPDEAGTANHEADDERRNENGEIVVDDVDGEDIDDEENQQHSKAEEEGQGAEGDRRSRASSSSFESDGGDEEDEEAESKEGDEDAAQDGKEPDEDAAEGGDGEVSASAEAMEALAKMRRHSLATGQLKRNPSLDSNLTEATAASTGRTAFSQGLTGAPSISTSSSSFPRPSPPSANSSAAFMSPPFSQSAGTGAFSAAGGLGTTALVAATGASSAFATVKAKAAISSAQVAQQRPLEARAAKSGAADASALCAFHGFVPLCAPPSVPTGSRHQPSTAAVQPPGWASGNPPAVPTAVRSGAVIARPKATQPPRPAPQSSSLFQQPKPLLSSGNGCFVATGANSGAAAIPAHTGRMVITATVNRSNGSNGGTAFRRPNATSAGNGIAPPKAPQQQTAPVVSAPLFSQAAQPSMQAQAQPQPQPQQLTFFNSAGQVPMRGTQGSPVALSAELAAASLRKPAASAASAQPATAVLATIATKATASVATAPLRSAPGPGSTAFSASKSSDGPRAEDRPFMSRDQQAPVLQIAPTVALSTSFQQLGGRPFLPGSISIEGGARPGVTSVVSAVDPALVINPAAAASTSRTLISPRRLPSVNAPAAPAPVAPLLSSPSLASSAAPASAPAGAPSLVLGGSAANARAALAAAAMSNLRPAHSIGSGSLFNAGGPRAAFGAPSMQQVGSHHHGGPAQLPPLQGSSILSPGSAAGPAHASSVDGTTSFGGAGSSSGAGGFSAFVKRR